MTTHILTRTTALPHYRYTQYGYIQTYPNTYQ